MTRTTNSRVAGFAFLFYIAAGITSMVLFGRATAGEEIPLKLVNIAQHSTEVRITVVLTLLMGLSALVLAVTLWAITRDVDPDLAMLGMGCRFAEGISGILVARTLGLLWLATSTAPNMADREDAHTLAEFLLKMGTWGPAATFFAVGSTIFSWLLLRGRMIPISLAWLGVFASVLLVVILPLQLAGLFPGTASWLSTVELLMWLPMLVFEVVLALWLMIKGVAAPVEGAAVSE